MLIAAVYVVAEPGRRRRDDPRQPAPADVAEMSDARRRPISPVDRASPASAPLVALPRRGACACAARGSASCSSRARGRGRASSARSSRRYSPDRVRGRRRTGPLGRRRALRHRPPRPRRVVALPLGRPLGARACRRSRRALGLVLGVIVGLVAAYSRGWLDDVLMRGMDVVLAFPAIVLALVAIATVGPEAVAARRSRSGFTTMPRVARVVRGAALEVVERDYVRAAEALGERARDPVRRGAAEHHQPAAGRGEPAPDLLHRPHRRRSASSASACSRPRPTGG